MSKVVPISPELGPEKNGDEMIVTLHVAELREIIRQEIHAIGRNGLEADEWVHIETAAKLMGVSVEWIYHNARNLPSRQKLGADFCGSAETGCRDKLRDTLVAE